MPTLRSRTNVPYVPWIHKSIQIDFQATRQRETDWCILMVHGGGWDKGDKDAFQPEMKVLAAKGYHCASINYRLSGDAIFPAPWHDVCEAVRYLRQQGLRVVLMGHSAGGHLVAMAGLGLPEGFSGGDDFRVEGVISLSGVHDLRYETMKGLGFPFRNCCEKLLGGDYEDEEVQRRAEQASPILYVRSALERNPDPPPFLFIHGDGDTGVPLVQALSIHETMVGLGYPVECKVVKGAPHYAHIENRDEVFEAVLAFLAGIEAKGNAASDAG